VKKFLSKFFPISKVQDLRRQVLNFKKGKLKELMTLGTVLMNYFSKAQT
jgi:hypothetical protein